MPSQPEILAPVGTYEMALAAVHNGADAIYLGVPGFNARGRTADFTIAQLTELVHFCRLRGVRVFYAMNVLVFERELRSVVDWLAEIVATRPDAFIVQDYGLARMLRMLSPEVELHGSTQMTVASAEAIAELSDLGIRRFVLARELPVVSIAAIHARTSAELEVFVHGALCVAYSGQCLTSESFGGRSANRGQCAQSCRLPYDMFVDGEKKDNHGRDYLFSPRDLCGLQQVEELRSAGVESFKIEGRLKTPEYVAATVAAYRRSVDSGSPKPGQERELEALYSRGFFSGWLQGTDHRHLVDGTYSAHQGQRLGRIREVQREAILAESDLELFAGDGVWLENSDGEGVGGRVFEATAVSRGLWRLAFARDFELRRIQVGWTAWRNDCPSLEKSLRRTWEDKSLQRRLPVQISVSGRVGEPLRMELRVAPSAHQSSPSDSPAVYMDGPILQPARRSAEAGELAKLRSEASALAGSVYALGQLHWKVDPMAFVPGKVLRQLRQEACQALDQQRLASAPASRWSIQPQLVTLPTTRPADERAPRLHLLVRSEAQLAEIEGLPLHTVILDFEYGRGYRRAIEKVRAAGFRVGLATLRVHRQGEDKHVLSLLDQSPDCILVRNPGALHLLRGKGVELRGDFSLNAVNSLAAEYLFGKELSTLHPGFDCNREQLVEMLTAMGGTGFEVSLHHYMPAFHMEHCVFAAFLSNGKDFRDCGVPCGKHAVEVEDHRGSRHVLQSDAECRNTLFVGRPQSALRLYSDLRELGVADFRIEVLQETAARTAAKVRSIGDVLLGRASPAQAIGGLGAEERFGITEGQLFQDQVWIDRKKA